MVAITMHNAYKFYIMLNKKRTQTMKLSATSDFDFQFYSDMHKDVFGWRPRIIDFERFCAQPEYRQTEVIDHWQKEIVSQNNREAKKHDFNFSQFRTEIENSMSVLPDWKAALDLMMQTANEPNMEFFLHSIKGLSFEKTDEIIHQYNHRQADYCNIFTKEAA